jgi:uncharacterized protein (TIGR02246 family)
MTRALAVLLTVASLFAATDEVQIRKVLDDQVSAWNRGDIPTFLQGYEDSPDLTFVGSNVAKGYGAVLERYKKSYPTKEKMGTLQFSGLEIRMLGTDYANVLGRFHLDRTKEAGGEAKGIFTLLFHRTPKGWKIIQDHTS